MPEVDDDFIDVHFDEQPEYTFGDLGAPAFEVFASYESVTPVMTKQQINAAIEKMDEQDTGLEWMVQRIFNQGREGSCHSADTEVLTNRGWTSWPDYNWSDPLGTMNPQTGFLEFQSPLQRHIYDYDGDMVYSTHRRLDFGVTANHRMLVRPWNEKQRTLSDSYQFTEAGSLGWYCGLPHATTGFHGTELVKVAVDGDREYVGDDFIALLGILVSDGWAGDSENTRSRVSFCCFNGERQQSARDLANRTGFLEQPGRPGVWYRQDAPALAQWLRANMYTGGECSALTKQIPEIVKWASMRQIRMFLESFGDKTYKRKNGDQFFTSSARLADDLQELHLRIGSRAFIGKRDPRESTIRGRTINGEECYVITVAGGEQLSLERKRNIEIERYRGPVYCATVPNGTLVTRRNGTLLVSGNCVANACAQAHQICQAKQFGPERVIDLAAISLYKQIGRSASSGARVSDGLDVICTKGILPLDTPKNRELFGSGVMPNTGFKERYPSNWEATAGKFLGDEFHVAKTVNGLMTALCNRDPVIVGREGHSICLVRPCFHKGNWAAKYPNSWNDTWGFPLGNMRGGFGLDTLSQITKSAQYCFVLRSVNSPALEAA